MAWLAIDAGTSVIKAVAYTDAGEELTVVRAATTVLHPQQGWSEQDMAEVWNAAAEALRHCAGEVQALGEPVRGLVCTAQGDGWWPVDATGEPAGSAILWNDGRATSLISQWQSEGVLDQAFRVSGSLSYAGLANAILRWLAHYQPEQLNGVRWALSCNGWLFSRMTGRFAAELTDACNPFSDVRHRVYADELLAVYGLSHYAPLLPPVCVGADAVGAVSRHAAGSLGLPAGVPVVMAPYDIVCTAYGAGAASPGDACVILGTTICTEVFTGDIDLASAALSGTTLALGDGTYLRAMPTLTGCEALEWAAQMLDVPGIEALGALAAAANAATGDPFFLPYLSPAGERSPFLATSAHGSFHGLRLGTSREDLARAMFEGLCFTVRECLEACRTAISAAPAGPVRICGGGARSDLWCEMLANVLHSEVVRAEGSEMGTRGAWLHALAVTREVKSVSEAIALYATATRTFAPSKAQGEFCDARYSTFLKLRDTAREQWHTLSEHLGGTNE